MRKENILYIVDYGHGGLNPITNKYVTPGKRSPKFKDGSVFYEGVNNRVVGKLLIAKLEQEGKKAIDLVNSWEDIKLSTRVSRANKIFAENNYKDCVYISIHSNAFGDGTKWTSPSGISAYTSVGNTKADPIADLILQELQCTFNESVKWRFALTDGDRDKEAHFYVLRKTHMPAILIEGGFHTNKKEVKKMMTAKWRNDLVDSIINGLKIWEHTYA